jgi:hypothetical protein
VELKKLNNRYNRKIEGAAAPAEMIEQGMMRVVIDLHKRHDSAVEPWDM